MGAQSVERKFSAGESPAPMLQKGTMKIKTSLENALNAVGNLEQSLIEYISDPKNRRVDIQMATQIKMADISNFKMKRRNFTFSWMERFAENIIRWESKR